MIGKKGAKQTFRYFSTLVSWWFQHRRNLEDQKISSKTYEKSHLKSHRMIYMLSQSLCWSLLVSKLTLELLINWNGDNPRYISDDSGTAVHDAKIPILQQVFKGTGTVYFDVLIDHLQILTMMSNLTTLCQTIAPKGFT